MKLFGRKKPEAQSSGGGATNERLGAIRTLDETFRDYDREIGLFNGEFFPRRFGPILMNFIQGAAEEGSPLAVGFFRDAIAAHPESGLAWYGLFTAIAATKSPDDRAEARNALTRALELGCAYATPSEKGVTLRMIGQEPGDD